MWGPSTGVADRIFPGKKLATFFNHHRESAVTSPLLLKNGRPFMAHQSRGSLIFRHAKNYRSFCGAPFRRGPFSSKTGWTCEHAEHA